MESLTDEVDTSIYHLLRVLLSPNLCNTCSNDKENYKSLHIPMLYDRTII